MLTLLVALYKKHSNEHTLKWLAYPVLTKIRDILRDATGQMACLKQQ